MATAGGIVTFELLRQLERLDPTASFTDSMAASPGPPPSLVDEVVDGLADGPPRGASVPFMITRAMRHKLALLGHSEVEVRALLPADAHAILEQAERRPTGRGDQ